MTYESRFDRIHGTKGALVPAAWSQTDSEVDSSGERKARIVFNHRFTYLSLQPLALLLIIHLSNQESSKKSSRRTSHQLQS